MCQALLKKERQASLSPPASPSQEVVQSLHWCTVFSAEVVCLQSEARLQTLDWPCTGGQLGWMGCRVMNLHQRGTLRAQVGSFRVI